MVEVSGVDEAGRGAVIGPLVICIVNLTSKDLQEINLDPAIKDSKTLSESKRKRIYLKYSQKINHVFCILQPSQIDAAVSKNKLNILEVDSICLKLRSFAVKPKVLNSDCMGLFSTETYFQQQMALLNPGIILQTFVKGESIKKEIALASIFAKEEREKQINKALYGSGYPSDKRTRDFLRQNPLFKERRFSWKLKKEVF